MPPVPGETGLYLKVNFSPALFNVKCNNSVSSLYLLGKEIKPHSLLKDCYLDQP